MAGIATSRNPGEDCVLIWDALIDEATKQRPISYLSLSQATGIPFGLIRGKSARLNAVYDCCLRKGLPPLSVLVIRKRQKTPGHGYTPIKNIVHDTEEVFAQDWSRVPKPKPEDFALPATDEH